MSTQSTLGDGFSDKKSEESTAQKRTHTQFAVTNPETPFPTTSSSPFGELKNTNNYRDDDRARFDERPTKLTRKFSVDKDDEDEDEDGRGDFAGRPQPMDKSFYELLVTFSRLDATNTQEDAKEPCPLCLKEFSAPKFATHVIDCVESKDGEERSKQIEEDAQLAQALQTSEDAEASSRRHSRKHHHRDRDRGRTKCRWGEACYETDPHHRKRFSHSPPKKRDGDEEMDSGWKDQGTWVKKTDFDLDQGGSTKMGGTGEKVCRDERNCKRTDAQHFINLVHPKVSCPICDQPFEVYQVEAHVNLCLTAEAPPASVLEAFGESAKSFSTIRSPLDGDSDDGDLMGDGDKSKKKGGKKSTSPDQKQKQKPTTNLSRQQLVAMSTLLVNQQNKGAAQQDFSVRKLLESFKTLGFTKETLQSALDSSPSSSSSSSGSSSGSSTSSSSSIFDPFSTGSTTNFSSSSQSSFSSNSFFPTDFFSSTTSASFSFGSSFSTTPMFSFSSSSSTSSSTPSSTTTASYEFGLGSSDDFETSSTFPSNQNTTWTNGHSNSSSGGGTGSASGSGSSSSSSHPPRPRIKIRVKPKQTGQTSSSSSNSQSTSTSSESGTSSENRDVFGSRSRSMP